MSTAARIFLHVSTESRSIKVRRDFRNMTFRHNDKRMDGVMTLTITKQRLLSAVRTLGAGEGNLDQRLRAAYREHLVELSVSSGLPPSFERDFNKLMAELGQFFNGGDSTDPRRASSFAKRVVALYDQVSRRTGDE